MSDTLTHRHSTHWREGDREDICPTVCGADCATVRVVYSGGDSRAVTCPRCLSGMTGSRFYVIREGK